MPNFQNKIWRQNVYLPLVNKNIKRCHLCMLIYIYIRISIVYCSAVLKILNVPLTQNVNFLLFTLFSHFNIISSWACDIMREMPGIMSGIMYVTIVIKTRICIRLTLCYQTNILVNMYLTNTVMRYLWLGSRYPSNISAHV